MPFAADDQAKTDRCRSAIVGDGGTGSACGGGRRRGGMNRRITPRAPTRAMAAGGDEARRAFAATMAMGKIDVAAIVAAPRG